MKVGEQVRPFQPLPRRAPPDPPAARESVWASRACLLYLPRRRSNCGRVADALGTPLQTLNCEKWGWRRKRRCGQCTGRSSRRWRTLRGSASGQRCGQARTSAA